MAIDHNGFIALPETNKLQPEFRNIVAQVVAKLIQSFPELIHSLYLYGSVAEGRAKIGTSDLDMTVIFSVDPGEAAKVQITEIQRKLEKIILLSVKSILIVVCYNR